jgi:hypothetical protein
VVNVSYGAHVKMGLRSFKFLFCHFFSGLPAYIESSPFQALYSFVKKTPIY